MTKFESCDPAKLDLRSLQAFTDIKLRYNNTIRQHVVDGIVEFNSSRSIRRGDLTVTVPNHVRKCFVAHSATPWISILLLFAAVVLFSR